MLLQVFSAVIVSLGILFCVCTLSLTCAKAMILRWIGVVMPGDGVQMALLEAVDNEEVVTTIIDRYSC